MQSLKINVMKLACVCLYVVYKWSPELNHSNKLNFFITRYLHFWRIKPCWGILLNINIVYIYLAESFYFPPLSSHLIYWYTCTGNFENSIVSCGDFNIEFNLADKNENRIRKVFGRIRERTRQKILLIMHFQSFVLTLLKSR